VCDYSYDFIYCFVIAQYAARVHIAAYIGYDCVCVAYIIALLICCCRWLSDAVVTMIVYVCGCHMWFVGHSCVCGRCVFRCCSLIKVGRSLTSVCGCPMWLRLWFAMLLLCVLCGGSCVLQCKHSVPDVPYYCVCGCARVLCTMYLDWYVVVWCCCCCCCYACIVCLVCGSHVRFVVHSFSYVRCYCVWLCYIVHRMYMVCAVVLWGCSYGFIYVVCAVCASMLSIVSYVLYHCAYVTCFCIFFIDVCGCRLWLVLWLYAFARLCYVLQLCTKLRVWFICNVGFQPYSLCVVCVVVLCGCS